MRIWSLTHCKLHVSHCDVDKYCLIIFNTLVMQHLPGQNASIITAFEFFGMFVSTRRLAQAFFGGGKVVLVFEIIYLSFDVQR